MGIIGFTTRRGRASLCRLSKSLSHLARPASTRTVSTIVGKSGREYVQGELLRRKPTASVFKAESQDESFILKRMPRSLYDVYLSLAAEFEGSRRLRVHVDSNQEEGILVYPYLRSTLLDLIEDDPNFPWAERQKILQRVGEAIQELHSKDWVHIDVKPDNILVNWTCDKDGNKIVTDVVLGDYDIAVKLKDGQTLRNSQPMGNVLWRSPEAQTGRGLTKASDIYSFGLVCIYALGGGELLIMDSKDEELAKRGVPLDEEIVARHFCYFGLVPEALLERIDSEDWSYNLRASSKAAEKVLERNPSMRFDYWGQGFGPQAHDVISRMTNPDPTARLTIGQVMAHEWWQLSK